MMDGPDEIGAYGPGTPSWAVVDGELYVTFIMGRNHYFRQHPTSANQDQRDGYRDEYNGIFHIKSDHTFERVIVFADVVEQAWGICAHDHPPYPGGASGGTSQLAATLTYAGSEPDTGSGASPGFLYYKFNVVIPPLPAGAARSSATFTVETGTGGVHFAGAAGAIAGIGRVTASLATIPDTFVLAVYETDPSGTQPAFAIANTAVTISFPATASEGSGALYGKIGWDYDGWVTNPGGGNNIYYGTPRSIQGELVFFEANSTPYVLVQETREMVRFRSSDGVIERELEVNAQGSYFNGDYLHVTNIDVDDKGDIWVHAIDSNRYAGNAAKDTYHRYPNLRNGTAPTKTHVVEQPRFFGGTQGAPSILSEPDSIWYEKNRNSDFAPYVDIVIMNKETGGSTVEFFDPGSGSQQLANTVSQGGFFKWQGKLYTQCYGAAFVERQADGTWIQETETPDYRVNGSRTVVPSKLDWGGYAVRGISDKFIWQVAYDNQYDGSRTGGGVTQSATIGNVSQVDYGRIEFPPVPAGLQARDATYTITFDRPLSQFQAYPLQSGGGGSIANANLNNPLQCTTKLQPTNTPQFEVTEVAVDAQSHASGLNEITGPYRYRGIVNDSFYLWGVRDFVTNLSLSTPYLPTSVTRSWPGGSTSSFDSGGYNPELGLTQGVAKRHAGVTNRANPFFWLYIDGTATTAARQRLIGGPYQPPIAATVGPNRGDLLFKPAGTT